MTPQRAPVPDDGVRPVPVGLVVVGLLVSGFAARPVVTSTSAELPSVLRALRGGLLLTGVIGALAPLVFAGGSFLAPLVIRRLGVARTLVLAGSAATAGLLVRVVVVDVPVFVVGTVLALAGVALANVALPTAVKRHLPRSPGAGTSAYTLMLAAGTGTAAAVTVPLGALLGGWRAGLALWAPVAAVAALPWLAVARGEQPARTPGATGATPADRGRFPLLDVARSPLGRAVTVLFAGQAASSYVFFAYLPSIVVADAGYSLTAAGLLLGLFSALGVVSSVVPLIVSRVPDQRGIAWVLAALWAIGDIGLVVAPHLAWLWVVSCGLGSGLFTLALTLVPLRTSTVAGSAALSAFAQGVAYLVSAIADFVAALVSGVSGSWTPVLLGLAVLMVPVALAGVTAGRPATLEQPPA